MVDLLMNIIPVRLIFDRTLLGISCCDNYGVIKRNDGGELRARQCHACGECQQPASKLAIRCRDICQVCSYLDTRSIREATLELQQGTANLVLHRRPALLMVVMVVVVDLSALSGNGTAAAEEPATAGCGVCRPGDGGAWTAAVGEGHDGLDYFSVISWYLWT